MTQQDLAEKIGVTNQQISRWESGKADISVKWISKFAEALDVPQTYLIAIYASEDESEEYYDSMLVESKRKAKERQDREQRNREAHGVLDGKWEPSNDRIPVFASVEAGNGEMSIGEQIGTIPKPHGLDDIEGGYAVHIVGDSMEPRLFQGWLAAVAPLPPRTGQFCVIQMVDEVTGDHRAVIKTYLRSRPNAYEVEQYNPQETKVYAKRTVTKIHRIVGIAFD